MMWKKMGLMIAMPMLLTACAGSYSSNHARKHYVAPKSDIPLVVNDKVTAWVDYFTGPGRDRFGRYIKRSGRYIPLMRQTLKSYGMPQDLVYLAMIESGFASKAKSHASAVGVWQFIRATGNRYGLEQDTWIDERQDVEKETHAAAQYLRDLYNEFGDWYLAMAAYNSGEGTVRRAISHYGTKDFWELCDPRKTAFRAETRDYVPKFIAAAIIARNPEKYGFAHIQTDAPYTYEVVTVDSPVDVEVIAKCVGTDMDTIDILNSELKVGTAPSHYKLKIPVGTSKKFQVALAKIPVDDRVQSHVSYEKHIVAKRESLNSIAKSYGVKPGSILTASGLKNARAVKRGMTLTIPVAGMSVASAGSSRLVGKSAPPLPTPVEIELPAMTKSGKFVAKVNRSVEPLPAPVAPVDVPAAVAVTDAPVVTGYVVSVGDSWNSISQNLGTSTKVLKTLNPDIAATGLHVGDVLQINDAPKKSAKSTVAEDDATGASDDSAPEVDVASTDTPVAKVPGTKSITKATVAKSTVHKVRPGDSLEKVANRYGVSVADLKSWNQLSKANHIRPGQKLMVTAPTAHAAKQTSMRTGSKSASVTPKKGKVLSYKVKPGDNLWTIGKKHNISQDQMKQLSQAKKGGLKPGDVITLRVGS